MALMAHQPDHVIDSWASMALGTPHNVSAGCFNGAIKRRLQPGAQLLYVEAPTLQAYRESKSGVPLRPARLRELSDRFKLLSALNGFDTVPMEPLTRARPDASWDGLHLQEWGNTTVMHAGRDAVETASDLVRVVSGGDGSLLPSMWQHVGGASLMGLRTDAVLEEDIVVRADGRFQPKGGVASMATQVLLNQLCNE